MALTKTIQATVKNRTDTAANWTQKNPMLAEGEIIVVQTSAGETRLKIGDGVKTFTQLPYTDEQIYNNVVTSVNGQTGDVTLDVSGGAGSMKKLTFTGAATGEYNGTTDVSVNIPSDVYVIKFDANDILINDFDELVNAIKSHKILVMPDDRATIIIYETRFNFDNSNNVKEVFLLCIMDNILCACVIDRDTKKFTTQLFNFPIFDSSTLDEKSGNVYYDKTKKNFFIKDTTPPIATASTAGAIKVGNGLSISADGTLSVTTATYYTGTADPVNTLGADGDLYLKTEG